MVILPQRNRINSGKSPATAEQGELTWDSKMVTEWFRYHRRLVRLPKGDPVAEDATATRVYWQMKIETQL